MNKYKHNRLYEILYYLRQAQPLVISIEELLLYRNELILLAKTSFIPEACLSLYGKKIVSSYLRPLEDNREWFNSLSISMSESDYVN